MRSPGSPAIARNVSLSTIRGLQFEALVGQSMIPAILERLNLRGVPVQRFGPYFQNKTAQHPAVQIDYLLQTDDVLYVCETKFCRTIEASVIDEVKEKVRRLEVPKEISVRKILIYSGELDPALKSSIYFDREICTDELL